MSAFCFQWAFILTRNYPRSHQLHNRFSSIINSFADLLLVQYSFSSMNSGQMGWNIEVSCHLRSSRNFHLLLLANVPTTTIVSIKSLWKFGGGWVVLLFLASSDVKVTKNKKVKINSKSERAKSYQGNWLFWNHILGLARSDVSLTFSQSWLESGVAFRCIFERFVRRRELNRGVTRNTLEK